jgi:hypothetical protein
MRRLGTAEVIERVRQLFHGQRSLIAGFNQFLPPGYTIEVPAALNNATAADREVGRLLRRDCARSERFAGRQVRAVGAPRGSARVRRDVASLRGSGFRLTWPAMPCLGPIARCEARRATASGPQPQTAL